MVKALLENKYEVTPDAIIRFAEDCREHESQLTVETLLSYVATLNRASYDQFAQTFRDTVKQDFTVFYRRLFPAYAELLDIICTALSQPVILVADLIHLVLDLNDSIMLS